MHDLRAPLEELADLVAGITDDDLAGHVLAGVVRDLERLAGADLPGTDAAVPVLVRRFARAHRLLRRSGVPAGELGGATERVQRHAAVLRDPLAALVTAWDEQTDAARPVSQPC